MANTKIVARNSKIFKSLGKRVTNLQLSAVIYQAFYTRLNVRFIYHVEKIKRNQYYREVKFEKLKNINNVFFITLIFRFFIYKTLLND